MHELLARHEGLDPRRIDDVVLGCVTPIGDQGADIAKTAAIKAGLPETVAGVQLNRFCASGLEAVNIAAQKVASGWEDLVLAGGVESMSRVPMGSDGGAWAMDPETNYDTSFVPQGIGADLIATVEGFSRDDVDAYAVRSQERAATARAEGRFANSVVPVLDINDNVVLDHDEFIRPGTTVETLAAAQAVVRDDGRARRLRRRRAAEVPLDRGDRPRPHARQLVRDRGRRGADGDRQRADGLRARAEAAGEDPGHRRQRRRPDDHAHRPRAGRAQGAGQGRA